MIRAALISLVVAGPASALTLDLPATARLTAQDAAAAEVTRLAIAPFAGGAVPAVEVAGAVTRRAWRLGGTAATTAQIMAPLARQIAAAGYEVAFRCRDRDCGGFDFRYALDLLPEPDMHVDLGDFRYLMARDPGIGAALALVVSRSEGAGFVHLTHVAGDGAAAEVTTAGAPFAPLPPARTGARTGAPDAPLIDRLEAAGRATLEDLDFATGSSDLGPGPFASLTALAAWLTADAARRVVLVGHSDAVGGLEGNIALSRRRAASVAARLREAHGVPAAQLSAEGVGFLAPRRRNTDAEGRDANRRVEVVALP